LLSNTLNEPSLVHFSSLLALIDVQFQFVFAPSTPSSSGSVRSPPIKAAVPVPSTSTEYETLIQLKKIKKKNILKKINLILNFYLTK